EVVNYFSGKIFLRVFGLSENGQYTNIVRQSLGDDFLIKLHHISHRFWFAQAYENLADIEPASLKSRAVFLPLALPKTRIQNQKWVGNIDKILFVCPRINSSPDY